MMKTKILGGALFAAVTLLSPADDAMTSTQAESEAATELAKPALVFQFEEAEGDPTWKAVNDGVMGGLSRGGPEVQDGQLLFAGILSLENNGGFSSVRTDDGPWDLKGTEGIQLRVMGDGRTYSLRLSTDARHRRSRIAYQAKFATTKGEWTEVSVPFASLSPSHHGNKLDGPPINLSQVTEIGLILADKNPGAFEIKVDWLKTYVAESDKGE